VPFPVYNAEYWWGGEWDAMQYGREFDFSRPFFEQMIELKNVVPHPALTVIPATLENSEYNNCVGYLKNCYLIAESDYNEDCYYSNLLKQCKDVCDSSVCYEDELCYECVDCVKCYRLLFSQDCQSCKESYFLFNCESCTNCIGCTNQRQQQFMILNEQLSKEEYERRKAELKLDTREGIVAFRTQFADFLKTQPHRFAAVTGNEQSSGDHLYDSKNARSCFDSKNLEDCAYCAKLSIGIKSCMDYNSWGDRAELVYFSTVCGDGVYNLRFCTTSFTNLRDCTYCDSCVSSSNLFGCVGLNKKQYCILNKQYTKEEYEALVAKIIEHMKKTGEWGEFFPKNYVDYGYNETLALDTFPMTREQALERGYRWQDELPSTKGLGTIESKNLPDTLDGIDTEQLLGAVLTCIDCERNYKLIPQELAFYKTLHLPVPIKCPTCRHRDRMALRRPLELWPRRCGCTNASHDWHHEQCATTFETAYAPERSETVFCEQCYTADFVS
jgi:hypothetical protein